MQEGIRSQGEGKLKGITKKKIEKGNKTKTFEQRHLEGNGRRRSKIQLIS